MVILIGHGFGFGGQQLRCMVIVVIGTARDTTAALSPPRRRKADFGDLDFHGNGRPAGGFFISCGREQS